MKRLLLSFFALSVALSLEATGVRAEDNLFRQFGKDVREAGRQMKKTGKQVGKDLSRTGKKIGKAMSDGTRNLLRD